MRPETPAIVGHETNFGEHRTIECTSGVEQGDGVGPPTFRPILVPIFSKLRRKYIPYLRLKS